MPRPTSYVSVSLNLPGYNTNDNKCINCSNLVSIDTKCNGINSMYIIQK